MKRISFLKVRWFLIIIAVLVGLFAIPQELIKAGTGGAGSGFTISDLTISPSEVSTGQSIIISATVKETNSISGNYEGTLKINGIIEATQTLTIGPSGSSLIIFTVSRNEAGIYSIDLDGLTGSFTVIGHPINESSDSSFPTVPIVIGIIAAVVLILLIFFIIKRMST